MDVKHKSEETKVMIFQRRAKRYDCNFYAGNEKIDNVQRYTYLGTQISSTVNFTLSLEHLREKAVHALFSLRRHLDFSSLKPSLACKIFDNDFTYFHFFDLFIKSDLIIIIIMNNNICNAQIP